jgi:AraC family transcriptional regulator
MQTQSGRGALAGFAPDIGREQPGRSAWRTPELEISKIKSWASFTVVDYRRGAGEFKLRNDCHRLVLTPDQLPTFSVQVEHGRTREMPPAAPGTLAFSPAGLTIRSVQPAAPFHQVLWDTDLYAALLPELAAAVPQFDFLFPFADPLLSRIVTTLVQESEGAFADRILVESLGTALCIRIAQRFIGHLPPPTSKGLSAERLRRVRDYIEAHLDDELSLTVLADIACLSPYHFSRSFKEAAGVGPQRYVIQRRLERAKTLLRRTCEPLAQIAQEAGFADQSHLTSIFRRELGVTPGRFRAALA